MRKTQKLEKNFFKPQKPSDKRLNKDPVVIEGSNYMKKGEVEN